MTTFASLASKCRRKFTPQEDENLKCLIAQFGANNWVKVAKLMPGRNAKQCRDRYCNYLSVYHRKDPWEPEEEQEMIKLVKMHGDNSWSKIASLMKTRSDIQCRNQYQKMHFLNLQLKH